MTEKEIIRSDNIKQGGNRIVSGICALGVGLVIVIYTIIHFVIPGLLLLSLIFGMIGGVLCFYGIAFFAAAGITTTVVITSLRVYWYDKTGNVSVPIEKITSVRNAKNSFGFTADSKSYHFQAIRNSGEMYRALQRLLDEQKAAKRDSVPAPVQQEPSQSAADELEKFKGLLDKGIITQEEFNAKKKQLLGL